MKRVIGLVVFFVMVFVGISYAAPTMSPNAAVDFLEGDILDSGRAHFVFYATSADGSCTDGTYNTYINTAQVPDATTEYELTDAAPWTATSSGRVAFIQSESFSQVTSLVMTISSATFSNADCIVLYYDTDNDDEASTGDVALYMSSITSISPSAEDVNITFPADDSSNALIRITTPTP